MRVIKSKLISGAVCSLFVEANRTLPEDVRAALDAALETEDNPQARRIISQIIENYKIAERDALAICQDTGLACVFIELGEDVHIAGSLREAVDEGVKLAVKQGYLRASIVRDPLRRENTGDNTPAMLNVELVSGEQIKITVAPKGAGSENMSAVKMLPPSDGEAGIERFVLDTVKSAGANPCPPIIVGLGIGGSFDKAPLLAKKALLRPLDAPNPDPFYAKLEKKLLAAVNALDIGPQGFGGKTTALGVTIETSPAHIASLPCAVNISCHVTRRKSVVL